MPSLPPIELLYNERYERFGDDGEYEKGPIYDVAVVMVNPLRARLSIELHRAGKIYLTHEGWETLVQQVKQRFEEVKNGS